MKKRFLSLTLAGFMAVGSLLPTVTNAAIIEDDAPTVEDELTINDLEIYKRKVQAVKSEAKQLTPHNKENVKMLNNFDEKTDELEVGIEKSFEAQGMAGLGFAQIYDLSSIPQRLMLIGRLCVAMRFATTALRYKVDQAHVEIAEYVFQGLIIAVSPFHTVDDMKAYMAEFEALKAKLIGYPDLTQNDTANLYVRSDLDAKLHKARFLYMNDLKEAPDYVLDELNKVIREVTRIRLQPQRTVAEIYQAQDMLDAAVGKAYSQLQSDHRATKTEIQDLKEMRHAAIKARRQGDKRKEVGDVIDASYKLIMSIRPSSNKVQEMIDSIRMILNMGPRM